MKIILFRDGKHDPKTGKCRFPYCIELFDNIREWQDYHEYRKVPFDFTESGYPKVLSMGYTLHDRELICILKSGNWQTRLIHEVGHELHRQADYWFKHVQDPTHVMYPFFNRGTEGTEEIIAAYGNYYGDKAKKQLRDLIE